MIKDLFLKYFAQKDSMLARWIASGLSAGIVYLITKFIPPSLFVLSSEQEAAIAGFSILIVNNIINEIVTNIQAVNAEKVQSVINKAQTNIVPSVHEDGRIGSVTLNALTNLVAVANVANENSNLQAFKSDIKQEAYSIKQNQALKENV